MNVSPQVPPPPGIFQDSTLRQDTSLQRNFPFPDLLDTSGIIQSQIKDSSDFESDTFDEEEDILSEKDTTQEWEVFLDSTARIDQFIHSRYDAPMVEMFPRKKYSLYLDVKSPAYRRQVELDSNGQFVTAREMVNGLDVKIPTTMTVEEYIHYRFNAEKLNNWRSMTEQYTLKQDKDDLSGFLGTLTNISIPVPANPLTNIFGGNEINLRISGGVDIRAAFRNTTSDQSSISQMDRSRNEPDFNQNVQINVGGTIGKKLNILADWNTQRTFEYENQLRIRYTGFDDEIIQSIEAGNVSLQTPSLVGGGQALFGIKSKLQTGPLTLTTLLSQKKGQTKELSVSGGATAQEVTIHPHEYSKNNFFLDTEYIKFFEEIKQSQTLTLTPEIQENQIIQLDVFLSVPSTPQYRQIAKEAIAYIDLPSHLIDERYTDGQINQLSMGNGRYYKGLFIQLDPNKDYKVDQYAGYITLQTSYNDNQVIAVSYTIVGKNKINRIYGGHVVGNDTMMYLKLIKPDVLYPSYRPAWDLLMKNFYSVRATNLKKEGFKLKVWRRTEGNDVDEIYGENLLTVLGLDRFDQYGSPSPDNTFDFLPGFTVDIDKGVIIFPSLRPFDSTIVRYFRNKGQSISDSLLFSDIYDTTAQAAQNNSIKNRYMIKVEAAGVQTSRYNLGFNLVEGSVQVLLNGTPLTPNVDYTVDYIVGEVVIRKPEALLPGANVQVKYEQNDLFQIASKTLIGARGELTTFKNTNLGFTIMNLNQETLSDKVRIGEEPTNNTMLGIDASTSTNAPFITDALDALPFYRTKEMSTLQFSGEAAYMLPDANTKKSSVSGDRGASIAYIDDFEGTRRSIPFPIMYTAWSSSSSPSYSRLGFGISDTAKTYAKASLIWYNRLPTDVVTEDIWPNRRTRAGQNQITVLNLDYDPNHRGRYNFSPYLDSTLHRQNIGSNTGKFDNADERRKNWNGLTRYIGSTAGSILEQNISYLEIWMKASSNENDLDDLRRGRIYINLGRVSEDVITNGELNSEDVIRTSTNPLGIPNGILNEGEDIGLDMKNNSEERIAYASFLTSNSGDPDVDPSDPSGDNWKPYGDGIDLQKFNGSEDNKQDPAGLLPNTEDLNGNGSVDLAEQYVEYELPLDTVYYDSTGIGLYKNIYHVGGGNNGWYQFRIPLLEATRIIGGSSSQEILQNVQHIRMWVSGFAHPISIRIAEINLIGNQWQERTRNDSLLKVSIVNIEDNPEYAIEWNQLGIVREKDRTDPNQIIESNEQSLALLVRDMPPDISREVVKYFTVRPLDIFNYKSMKMFVHGDPTFNQDDAEIFLRFGSDTMNFYEYRQPIHPGWDLANNEVKIDFGGLTSVKAIRSKDSLSLDSLLKIVYNPVKGAPYGVKGNPSLRQIREISIGIKNKGTSILRGEVWVNELRLVEVDNSPGIAYRFGSQMKLADLGSVSFNYAQTDPNFHGLDQRFGNQITNINWGVNANVSLDRLFPQNWQGTSIPIAYSHSENLIKPRYLPNTDIVVQEVANRAATPDASKTIVNESQTLNVRDTYSLSNFRIVPPTQAWYIRDTFSKLSLSVNYGTTNDRDPAFITRKSWQWNLRVNYGVSLPGDYYFQPFKKLFADIIFFDEYKNWKFYYIPITNISTGIGGQRSRSYEIPRAKSAFRETRNFGGSKSAGFGWKFTEGGLSNISGDYNLSIDRNLLPLDNDSIGRGFMEIMKSLFFRGQDNRYSQRVTINTKPKIPNILDIPKYFDLSAGYSVAYAWQNNFQRGDIGKSAGFDNNITFSLGFRLKSLTDPWFESKPSKPATQPKPDQRDRSDKKTEGETQDSIKKKEEITSPSNLSNIFSQLKTVTKYLIKIPLLDYESINISYTQGNRSGNGAVVGSTGFKNFWGRLPFDAPRLDYGPSRLYQLGLIADPSGTLRFTPKSKFPFLGWKVTPGIRAAKASFTDQYSQSNNVALKTNRPLWKGASIDFNWKVGWQYSRSTTVVTDSLGIPNAGEPITSGSIERSFLTFPPVFLFKSFKSNLEEVGKRYNRLIETQPANVALAESFEKGLEALPFLSKLFGQYAPRANWTIRWDGIDKISFLNYAFDRLSLEHNYTSSFRRDFRSYPGKGERTDGERINYGFNPLVGLNMTFKQLLKGNFSGNFRYVTTTAYDLNLAASQPNIVSTMTQEIALSLSYSRRGFSLPLFGWSLSNDIDISFSYSRTKNNRRRYDPQYLSIDQEGIPLEGNTRTTLEPRIRYVLSTRVTAALFYRYSKTEPDATGSLIFGTTTNEGGVDIRISI